MPAAPATLNPLQQAAQAAAAKRQWQQQRRRAPGDGAGGDAPDAHSAAIGVGASLLVAAAAGCINVVITIPM